MRKFKNLLNIQEYKTKSFIEYLINESITYTYKAPQDPKQQLFDFYIWVLFYQYGLNKILPGMEDNKQDLQNIVVDATEKIVNAQQQLLLSVGLTSIAAELRHVVDMNSFDEIKQLINNEGKYNKFYKWLSNTIDENVIPAEGNNLARHKAGQALTLVGYQSLEFVELAKIIYSNLKWKRRYGGQAWKKICEGWIKLYHANNINSKILAIDHLYDLQHNTGFALNKTIIFSGEWVQKALELKADSNIWELSKLSSIPQRIIGYLVKLSGVNSDKESEDKNLEKYTVKQLYEKAIKMGKRWPEAEPIIMKDPGFAYYYARDIIKGRWPETEPIIMKDPEYAFRYAQVIIKDRWLEAEPYIMQNKFFWKGYLYFMKGLPNA